MYKLKLIIKREFLAKVRNKSFIVMTILSPLIMVAMVALIAYLNIKNSEEVRTVAFIDQSGIFTDVLKDSKTTKYVNLSPLSLEIAREQAVESNFYGLIFIPKQDSLDLLAKSITLYGEGSPSLSLIGDLESKFQQKIRDIKIEKMGFDIDKIKAANTKVEISAEKYTGEKASKVGSVLKMVAGGAFGYLIFMFIIIYGTSVMRSVIEEKTNRIIEVIISSVQPFHLMLGKIVGNALAGILQFVIWMVSAGVLMFVISSALGADFSALSSNTPQLTPEMTAHMQESVSGNLTLVLHELKDFPFVTLILSFIFYFLGGYLIYSSIYAAIGAAVDNETDTQQFMFPVMIPLMIAIYVGFSVIENPHGPIAVAFSIFPLTSPIVMLMRIPFGVPWWQISISMLLLIITFLGVVWFAAKIYRVGILMYGKKPSYKELYKWLKY
ncbi:MAG: ABC transporter permease [Flavobacteriales bacterium CG_4_9_14_0_2_um_filter_35_242]|nr:ABC transporter permease [Zetaproteobacteria bacterium]NDK17765.1 ABC transporter permease [Flavobacteriales bacterium]OIO12670.1 MAG: ABC transporter permease [Flavobacteriaceae bacterium CG1_02_35_72]PIV19541.1 MAG: ABC transporter permease [Flavobacteriales bacterium CG03_land_8_20_14_0_80_35_15]PIX07874.1 MAG: ABC transporter permease [Flavobacteriales bacterium CG_4_8_14_3_um_filter_35_10]PJA04692.1 MAG: ABC transporter permease [Flavobacteriales bacterium CG_4_10_14_0_2_um_filter_35_1